MNANLDPFREKRSELDSKPDMVWDTLHDGAKRARVLADETMKKVRAAIQLPE